MNNHPVAKSVQLTKIPKLSKVVLEDEDEERINDHEESEVVESAPSSDDEETADLANGESENS